MGYRPEKDQRGREEIKSSSKRGDIASQDYLVEMMKLLVIHVMSLKDLCAWEKYIAFRWFSFF